jgi:hypothetical protein
MATLDILICISFTSTTFVSELFMMILCIVNHLRITRLVTDFELRSNKEICLYSNQFLLRDNTLPINNGLLREWDVEHVIILFELHEF